MTTNAKSRAAAPVVEMPPDLGLTPPWTREDRLLHIQALGKRIERSIQFICAVGDLNGTSTEAKDKAVAVFYERLSALERQLSRIQEDLELG
jgi:hypothetical protein